MLKVKVQEFVARCKGQGMAEYGLILALVAIVAIVGVALLGPKLRDVFQNIVDNLNV